MGGCQSYGPFLGILNIRGRIIVIGTQKGDHNFDNHPYVGTRVSLWRGASALCFGLDGARS